PQTGPDGDPEPGHERLGRGDRDDLVLLGEEGSQYFEDRAGERHGDDRAEQDEGAAPDEATPELLEVLLDRHPPVVALGIVLRGTGDARFLGPGRRIRGSHRRCLFVQSTCQKREWATVSSGCPRPTRWTRAHRVPRRRRPGGPGRASAPSRAASRETG